MEGSHLRRGSQERGAAPRGAATLSARPYNAEKHEDKRVAEGWPEVEGSFSIRRRFRFSGQKGGLRERREKDRTEKRDKPIGWTMMFLALEFFLPPQHPTPLLLADPFRFAVLLHPAGFDVFRCFTWKKQVSANKGRGCTELAWISGRSCDYNGRDNAYYAPQHGLHRRSSPHGNESSPENNAIRPATGLLKD